MQRVFLMRGVRRLALFGMLLASCRAPRRTPAASPRTRDETLRASLLAREATDQEARTALFGRRRPDGTLDSADIAAVVAVDSANTAWLRRVVLARGWPGFSVAGRDGEDAAFV